MAKELKTRRNRKEKQAKVSSKKTIIKEDKSVETPFVSKTSVFNPEMFNGNTEVAVALNKLNKQQQIFALEYVKTKDYYSAYKKAGYSGEGQTGYVSAWQIAKTPNVAAVILLLEQEFMKEVVKETRIDRNRILLEVFRIATFDSRKLWKADGKLKKIIELDDDAAAVVSGMQGAVDKDGNLVPKKITCWNKNDMLKLACEYFNITNDKHKGEQSATELAEELREAERQMDATMPTHPEGEEEEDEQ